MKLRTLAVLILLPFMLAACGSEEGAALCEAINTEDLEAVEALIAQGADVNEHLRFQGNFTQPTRIALSKVTLESERRDAIAIAVLEAGGDPNLAWSFGGGAGSSGHTIFVLTVVAGAGRTAVVDAMLKAGAEVDGQPRGGDALVAAAKGDHVEILSTLIDAGADMNYKNRGGDTPLGAAVEARAREAIAFLEERGAREW